jgi:hypothetical protein
MRVQNNSLVGILAPLETHRLDRSMKETMKTLIATMLATAYFLGCAKSPSVPPAPQSNSWQVPALPERQQELILTRAVELMRESGHWQGYPLTSLGFD